MLLKSFFVMLLTGCILLVSAAAEQIKITGTVKDKDGKPITGVKVSLVKHGSLDTTTNNEGKFELTGQIPVRVVAPSANSIRNSLEIGLRCRSVQFTITSKGTAGALSFFAGNGRKVASIPLDNLSIGTHRHALPSLSAGLYIMKFSIDKITSTHELLFTESVVYLFDDAVHQAGNVMGKTAQGNAGALDTLLAVKSGYKNAKTPVTSFIMDNVVIVMETEGSTTNYTQKGSFTTTVVEANKGPSNGYTIFRPDPLGKDGFLHPPIIFGPGIVTSASQYTTLLSHLASYGFVTICVNSMTGGPNDPGNLQAMKAGLDWLIAQNSEAGVFQGKLAVKRATTMGYSIGATASVQLCSHEAIMTTVAIHGHNTSGDPHGPVLLMTGTQDVIDDVRKTLSTLEEAPAILVALPIGHLNVMTEISASGRYVAPITAWLCYWVNGDDGAKRFFWGADCEMCKSPWITPETNAKWKALNL